MRQITQKHLKICLDKANEMFEKYQSWEGGSSAFPRNDDLLGRTCTRDLETNIRVSEADVAPEEIKDLCGGLCLVNEDGTYDIHIHSKLNTCWKRFIQCKELFHVVLDEQEYRTMDLHSHLKQIIEMMPTDEDDGIYLPGVSELMAEIAAMEFLFPYSERVKVKASKNINLFDVAKSYMIPQKYVAIYLSDAYIYYLNPASVDSPSFEGDGATS